MRWQCIWAPGACGWDLLILYESVQALLVEEALMAAKIACSLANKDECVMCGA